MTKRGGWSAITVGMLAAGLAACAGDVGERSSEPNGPAGASTSSVVPNTPELQRMQAQTGVAIAALTDPNERHAAVARAARLAQPVLAALAESGCSVDVQRDAQTYRFQSAGGEAVLYVAFKNQEPCAGQPAQTVAAVDLTRGRVAAQVSYSNAQSDGRQLRRFVQDAEGRVAVRDVSVQTIEQELTSALASVQNSAAQCSTTSADGAVGCSSAALRWGDCGLLEQLLTYAAAGAPGAIVLYALLPGSTLLSALAFFISGGLLYDTAARLLRTCQYAPAT